MISRGLIFTVTVLAAFLGFWILSGGIAWAAKVVFFAGLTYFILDFFSNRNHSSEL